MYRGISLNFPHILRINGLLYTSPNLCIPFCIKTQYVEITEVAEKQRTSGFTRKFRVLELMGGVEDLSKSGNIEISRKEWRPSSSVSRSVSKWI